MKIILLSSTLATLASFSTPATPLPPAGLGALFGSSAPYYIQVFGVHVVASPQVSKAKFVHMASVLAQYLDNDEDGSPDDPLVVQQMVNQKPPAMMILFKDEREERQITSKYSAFLDKFWWQNLFNDECFPGGSNPQNGFDATLEEVLHLVSDTGWARAYPQTFGPAIGTELANAMDIARGGRFNKPPPNYPSSAWYHYTDQTCWYDCQATEYFYWLLTSILGAQNYPGRAAEIAQEWECPTAALVQSTDLAGWALMTDGRFSLPTVLPDGSYP